MAEKQPHLNGAYYGPAVPPPNRYYHRHGSSRGCGCCGCLFSLLFKLIVSVAIVVGLAVLIFWLIVRPNRVKFHVTDASLTQFNFTTNNNTLHYNLSLDINVRNPNKKIGIYYDRIEARAYFEDQRFSTVTLPPFYQGHKNTTVLSPVFKGQQVVLLGAEGLSELNSDKSGGVFDVDVKLYLRIRFKLGKVKSWRMRPKIKCDLKVPLSSNGKVAVGFQTTKCDIDF
ncbi:NDR1/HIN1-like protein 10 [Juglans regia]|uniref:NDR1/HIN1-like protein 10 n=1 Tax=Juglans regia TaxID=51240 RepID=A0A2I4H500_JUGRE|nr:NDR1/HIN1-like protein 10 [Juglans regia]